MGSVRVDGVVFLAYSHDHLPMHVHGLFGRIEVIIDLTEEGSVALSDRSRAVIPSNAPRNAIRDVINVAAMNYARLRALWETVHGA